MDPVVARMLEVDCNDLKELHRSGAITFKQWREELAAIRKDALAAGSSSSPKSRSLAAESSLSPTRAQGAVAARSSSSPKRAKGESQPPVVVKGEVSQVKKSQSEGVEGRGCRQERCSSEATGRCGGHQG